MTEPTRSRGDTLPTPFAFLPVGQPKTGRQAREDLHLPHRTRRVAAPRGHGRDRPGWLGRLRLREQPSASARDQGGDRELSRPDAARRSAIDTDDIHHLVSLSPYWRGGASENSALAGVDIALWDVKGGSRAKNGAFEISHAHSLGVGFDEKEAAKCPIPDTVTYDSCALLRGTKTALLPGRSSRTGACS